MSKHMSLEDRTMIEEGLNRQEPLARIASMINRDRSTISREIKRHRIASDTSGYGRIPNRCIHRRDCSIYGLCEQCKHNGQRLCASCNLCNKACPEYTEEHCPKLSSPPYVCNGCLERPRCVLRKFIYTANKAQAEYREMLVETRYGFNLTIKELMMIDRIVSPLLKNGQSIHHIWFHHSQELPVCERTIARLLEAGQLSAGILDQQRKCGLKPRKSKPSEPKVDPKCRIGRKIEDYERFMLENKVTSVVQMDTVYGTVGGKVLFTLIFTKAELMLAFLCENRTAACIQDKLRLLWTGLGEDMFSRLFPVLLTDNGSEFSNPTAIEKREDGLLRTHVFYCDPSASYQKGALERNHEFIRLFFPQGSSFDELTQNQIDLMMSHINSYSRPILNDKTPYEMFAFLFGNDALERLLRLLCLTIIPPDEIVLKRSLLFNS